MALELTLTQSRQGELERVLFSILAFALAIMRLLILIYFFKQVKRFSLANSGLMNSPDKLVVGTLIFLIGSTLFSIIDQFPYLLQSTGIQAIEDFFAQHQTGLTYMHMVTYHISYCLQNIAIILSIGRWVQLVQSFSESNRFDLRVSLISGGSQGPSKLDKVHFCILIACLLQTAVSMIIITLDLVQLSSPGVLPKYLTYGVICAMNLAVVPLFLYGYAYSYRKLTLYHE